MKPEKSIETQKLLQKLDAAILYWRTTIDEKNITLRKCESEERTLNSQIAKLRDDITRLKTSITSCNSALNAELKKRSIIDNQDYTDDVKKYLDALSMSVFRNCSSTQIIIPFHKGELVRYINIVWANENKVAITAQPRTIPVNQYTSHNIRGTLSIGNSFRYRKKSDRNFLKEARKQILKIVSDNEEAYFSNDVKNESARGVVNKWIYSILIDFVEQHISQANLAKKFGI